MESRRVLSNVMSVCLIVGLFTGASSVWGALNGDAFRELRPFVVVAALSLGAMAGIDIYGRRRWGGASWWKG